MRYLTTIIVFFSALFFSCNPITERIDRFDVHGIDVSHYQSSINWDLVAQQDISFAFVKATEGESYLDSLYYKNWRELKRVGIARGAYHFFRANISAKVQANNFINKVFLEPGDLPPVLDVETTDKVDKKQLVQQVQSWVKLIEQHYNIRPVIYTNFRFYHDYLAGTFREYPIWIARYSNRNPSLEFGKKWKFWQYGDRGKLDGISGYVDFNVFHGSHSELKKMTIPNTITDSETFPVSYSW